MDKKLLFIGNVAGKNIGVNSFCLASIMAAKELGLSYYLAANFSQTPPERLRSDEKEHGVKICQIDFIRNPLNPKNFRAYKQLVKLIQDENIDYIHCNTPVGGVLGRLAGKRCKVKKVIYQVHGFHFYKGAPKLNWMLYYPVERWMAHYTDALITINNEDYELAKSKFKLRGSGKIYYVPGVGIDISKCGTNETQRIKKRTELEIPLDAFVLVSVGELNENKNNRIVIQALESLGRSDIYYVLCGVGEQESALKKQVSEAGLQGNVRFLGYRNDVKEIYAMSDCFVMSSYREGLPRSVMEAMASGLPCVVSNIRGIVDLIDDGAGGYCCGANSGKEFADAIIKLHEDKSTCRSMGKYNQKKVKEFDITKVIQKLYDIYKLYVVD